MWKLNTNHNYVVECNLFSIKPIVHGVHVVRTLLNEVEIGGNTVGKEQLLQFENVWILKVKKPKYQ